MKTHTFLEKDFDRFPNIEKYAVVDFTNSRDDLPVFTIGIKTLVKSFTGLNIVPTKQVVFEIKQGGESATFAMNSSGARRIAAKLIEFADRLDGGN